MTDMKLDLDELTAELKTVLTKESAYKMERLLHTYVANPVTGLYMQVEIIKRVIDRQPDMLPDEVANLSKQISLASANIVTVVKALAGAFPEEDEEKNADETTPEENA